MGNDPVPPPGSVDLTQQRKDRAAHALAALRDLEAAIEAEIEQGEPVPDEVVYMTVEWLNDNAMDVIEGLT